MIKAPPVYKISLTQLAVNILLSAFTLIIWDMVSAYSLLLGGFISIIPNAYFTNRFFRERGAQAMGNVVRNVLIGEIVKLILMGIGFALVFNVFSALNVVALFAGFIFVHLVGLIAIARTKIQ